MKFLADYIKTYSSKTSPHDCRPLAQFLQEAKNAYDARLGLGGNAKGGFAEMVGAYNRIGQEKGQYGLSQNPLRNLTGALLQDYTLSLIYEEIRAYPKLDVFTEAQVALGLYPLWTKGEVAFEPVSEQSDLAVGYLWDTVQNQVRPSSGTWPRGPLTAVPRGCTVLPLVAISSKIRVSKQEFFDWFGRYQLMGKGNPHCLNIQVALRREMRISIVEVAQVHHRFFLLGTGDEGKVRHFPEELDRLLEAIAEHLQERMGNGSPASEELQAEVEASESQTTPPEVGPAQEP